ncbi:MAG TPA: LPXTG cell wall anchor domain-containing protein [Tangfeifania sp.]|nr:LPXTG cell wall anchor domain-containing protein [Tangfeifania sp.]
MEKIKSVIATLVLGILSLPYKLMAQDESSYIENLGVQDSSYMEEGNPVPAGTGNAAEQASGSGSTAIIIIIAVVIIVAAVFFVLRKKKK